MEEIARHSHLTVHVVNISKIIKIILNLFNAVGETEADKAQINQKTGVIKEKSFFLKDGCAMKKQD